jgi:hypothetical protein
MTEVLFSLCTFCFLVWVLILRTENADLHAEIKRIRGQFKHLFRETTGDVKVIKTHRFSGNEKQTRPPPPPPA